MFDSTKIYAQIAGCGVFFALLTSSVLAQSEVEMEIATPMSETRQFSPIEQPLGLKIAVALGGVGLIGAELWWFMFSNSLRDK